MFSHISLSVIYSFNPFYNYHRRLHMICWLFKVWYKWALFRFLDNTRTLLPFVLVVMSFNSTCILDHKTTIAVFYIHVYLDLPTYLFFPLFFISLCMSLFSTGILSFFLYVLPKNYFSSYVSEISSFYFCFWRKLNMIV